MSSFGYTTFILISEFLSAFEFYSKRKDNKVAVSRLPNLCRALGFNLSSKDVEYMLTEHDNGTYQV